jgi:hypothetical protein
VVTSWRVQIHQSRVILEHILSPYFYLVVSHCTIRLLVRRIHSHLLYLCS